MVSIWLLEFKLANFIMKVSLFVSCLVDQLFPVVGDSTVKVLKKLGVEVEFDRRQTCCGQPAFNSGYVQEARQVASVFLEIFKDAGTIVVPSGSCCTMIKIFFPQLFPKGSKEEILAREISKRTFELSDFLVSVLGVTSVGACFPEVVTYHDSCHLLRELNISRAPRQLIGAVEGINFKEMKDCDRCCGFGGTFSVKFSDVSAAIGEDKIRRIEQSGAQYLIATDVSCLMHLDGLLRRHQVPVKTMHLAELLAQ